MASEWRVHTLADCMAAIIDYRGKTPQKTTSGIPLITAKVVKGGRIERTDEFIAPGDYRAWMRRGLPKAGDVLVTTEAPLGEVAQLGSQRVALAQRLIALRGKPQVLDNTFLKFLMQSDAVQNELRARSTGTTVLGIRQSQLRMVSLNLPPFNEQRAIAHILGTLDHKIELNQQMNETLEAIARTVFKSWFVDFDPVRAKADGRKVGLAQAIYDVFPKKLERTTIGQVPADWRLASLREHFDAVKGVSYKGSGLRKSGMPLHNLNSVFEGGGYKYQGIKYYDGEYSDRHEVRPGDVIVANTEQGHERLLIGYAAVIPKMFDGTTIASHHIYRMRPRRSSYLTARFLYYLLNSRAMHDVVSGYANGTTVNMLPLDGVQKPVVVVPPRELVDLFDRLAIALQGRVEEAILETRTLTNLRDTLLPKLISGELRIKDAERFLAKANL